MDLPVFNVQQLPLAKGIQYISIAEWENMKPDRQKANERRKLRPVVQTQ
jgi:hypothetical protein